MKMHSKLFPDMLQVVWHELELPKIIVRSTAALAADDASPKTTVYGCEA